METILTVVFVMFGMAVGSFLNVCIDRLTARKSLAYPPSHCDTCQHPLSPADLVPVFSYLWLRGRCRYCRAHIPLRSLFVEMGTGILFGIIYWRYGLSADAALTAFYSSVFVVIMVIDMEHQLILNRVIYPAAAAALIILAIDFFLPGPGFFRHLVFLPQPKILSGIIGGAAGFIFFLIPFLIHPRGMGAGDVKLAGLIGLVTGFPMVFGALFIGIISGGVVAIALLILKIKGRKDALPYGAFLALGPIVILLWGNNILNWYLGFA
jgi:leader peptidase (prepilin peptidase)/N-methyltransferase